jgi:type IV pilus assembly protein PilQ
MAKNYFVISLICAAAAHVAAQTPSPVAEQPAPIEPPILQAAPTVAPKTETTAAPKADGTTTVVTTSNGRAVNEFQGDEIGQVLRLLARQAKINMVVSEKVVGTVTMRLEEIAPLQAIKVIVTSRGLVMDTLNDVYYVKTPEEKAKEPTESANYTFSYASAEKVAPLLTAQLQGGVAPQVDVRTNTVFYRETGSNMANINLFLQTIDRPTQQVMIEARLVEVTANPQQGYGINWGGVVGSASSPQTIKYGGSTNVQEGSPLNSVGFDKTTGKLKANDFFLNGQTTGGFLDALAGQFAILSVPQMSLTLRMLNEDSDAEFLANPRVVTANNQKATIKITRNQPVPQLNFNEQTATAVFGGFQDKEFGNTLIVTPVINKDEFITLSVQPEISNKVGDATFTFAGATVASPIIDKRSLESNVLIKSGDTLAIGGLLQDEVTKSRSKVPVLGDIPVLGYVFQQRANVRTKRNLLVFVTPTLIKQGYGTGLEDQVSGLHHSGEEYADPNGWRNNARGAIRATPTSNRQNAADYPKPGTAPEPARSGVRYKVSALNREK